MNGSGEWQASNARQLAAALAALRERLERFARQFSSSAPASASDSPPAPSKPAPAVPPPVAGTISRNFIQRLLGQPAAPEPDSKSPPSTGASPRSEQPSTPAAAPEPPCALDVLGDRLGLSAFERNVLLLCAGVELDTRIAGLCARAQDDSQKPFPTFGLALALFDDAAWDVLAPERPLRYWRLIDIQQHASQPLTASALRADERIVSYLKGLNYLDERVSPFFAPLDLAFDSAALADSQAALVESILTQWQQAPQNAPLPVVQMVGADPISKQLVAYHASTRLNRRLYRLNAETLPTAPSDLEVLARLWQRESRLLPLALYLDAEELDGAAAERAGSLSRFLSRTDGVFFLSVREVMPRLGRSRLVEDIAKPTATEQHAAWVAVLGEGDSYAAARLAGQFNLNLPSIEILARLGREQPDSGTASRADRVWDICCASERPRLDALAQRLEPKMNWNDLVLPRTEMELLTQIAAQVGRRNQVYRDWGFDRKMNRGFGINALFAGDSGTGKTMAAEVIANELRLNLYRIDLSQVVNKYIGETEKNLRRLFDAAEDGGAILFFDEADALFGKRSEVKDSHDRYANIEINYLLQRIESYRGLAILATNMKGALDTAFLRRLRFIVNFPFPTLADRRRLWAKAFLQHEADQGLPSPPLGKLDYDRLAKLNLTGGHIHNVALNAAFLAAHRETPVTMTLILEAARAEFQKLGHSINEADFRLAEPAPSLPKPAPNNGQPVAV